MWTNKIESLRNINRFQFCDQSGQSKSAKSRQWATTSIKKRGFSMQLHHLCHCECWEIALFIRGYVCMRKGIQCFKNTQWHVNLYNDLIFQEVKDFNIPTGYTSEEKQCLNNQTKMLKSMKAKKIFKKSVIISYSTINKIEITASGVCV